jgi:predicted nucleotide-binding protein (sugar kinase/HSP70/actin superfamily)
MPKDSGPYKRVRNGINAKAMACPAAIPPPTIATSRIKLLDFSLFTMLCIDENTAEGIVDIQIKSMSNL